MSLFKTMLKHHLGVLGKKLGADGLDVPGVVKKILLNGKTIAIVVVLLFFALHDSIPIPKVTITKSIDEGDRITVQDGTGVPWLYLDQRIYSSQDSVYDACEWDGLKMNGKEYCIDYNEEDKRCVIYSHKSISRIGGVISCNIEKFSKK